MSEAHVSTRSILQPGRFQVERLRGVSPALETVSAASVEETMPRAINSLVISDRAPRSARISFTISPHILRTHELDTFSCSPDSSRYYSPAEIQIAELRDAVLMTPSGVIFVGQKIVSETLRMTGRQFSPLIHPLDDNIGYLVDSAIPLRGVNAPVLNLTQKGQGNYYHWMIDILPRLYVAERFLGLKNMRYAVSRVMDFQKQTVGLFGFVPGGDIWFRGEPTVCRELWHIDNIFGPTGRTPGTLATEYTAALRSAVLSSRVDGGFDRLYISRRDSSNRVMVNEAALEQRLGELGFAVVCLSGLSVPEQATLFNSAKVIVAPHGAGLTNLLFANSEARVVEIFPSNYINFCFFRICGLLNLEYAAVTAPVLPQREVGSHQHSLRYIVDPQIVEIALKELGV